MAAKRSGYNTLSRGRDDDEARREILRAYEECQGNTSAAAQRLGVHKTTLLRAVRRLGLSADVSERWPSRVRDAYVLLSNAPSEG